LSGWISLFRRWLSAIRTPRASGHRAVLQNACLTLYRFLFFELAAFRPRKISPRWNLFAFLYYDDLRTGTLFWFCSDRQFRHLETRKLKSESGLTNLR
jgi:hypothetical protein